MVFKPKGDRAQWRIIYDEVRKYAPGDTVSYERLSELLGRDFPSNRATIVRAIEVLEDVDHRTLACVRGVGYRVAAATEHETLAQKHSTRSRRQLGKAAAKVRSADRTALTADQARRLDALEMQYSEHAEILQRLEGRDKKRQAEIKELRREHSGVAADFSEQIAAITEALQRHGIGVAKANELGEVVMSEGTAGGKDAG